MISRRVFYHALLISALYTLMALLFKTLSILVFNIGSIIEVFGFGVGFSSNISRIIIAFTS